MKAAVYRSYGPPEVLKVEDIQQPTIENGGDDRVLIKVHSASVNPHDYLYRSGYPPIRLDNGLLKPKQQVLGIDVAGTITAIGSRVTRFRVGDHVFGNCWGSHAEFVRARESRLAAMPKNATFNDAAAIPTVALTALQALRDVARLKKDQQVLVYGASGGIGHMAVQLARYYGAEVTAVCSTSNLAWVKALGAHHVIDYTREDFARQGKRYDLILDAVGKRTYFSCKPALTDTGIYISEHPLKPRLQPLQWVFSMLVRDGRMKTHLSQPNAGDMDFIRERVEAGELKPVMERCYRLDQIVEAHRHVENGRTRGKVVIEIESG